MKNHPQTRRAHAIDQLIGDRLRQGRCSVADLVLGLRISQHGVRSALLRLTAQGSIVCALDASVQGYPKRVWTLKKTITTTTTDDQKLLARRRTPGRSTDSLTASSTGVIR